MSNQNRHIILFISLLAILSSCEKEIDFSGQYDNGIAVYAIAVPGEPFSIRLSRSFTVNDNPTVVFSHYSSYYSELDTLYRTEIVIDNAQVEVTVNGSDKYTMTYNPVSPYPYLCDYVPREGDNITVKASASGYHDISASTRIEKTQKIQIAKTEVVYKDNGDDGSVIVGNPLDRFGVEIPMELRGAFAADTERDRLESMLARVVKMLKQAMEAQDSSVAQYRQIDLIELQNLLRTVRFTKPYCVCRICQGNGRGSCSACHETGFQTEEQYRRNPKEFQT